MAPLCEGSGTGTLSVMAGGIYGIGDAELLFAPAAGVAVTAGNGASGTAVDLTAHRDKFIALRFPGKTHIRFGGSSVAAATTDLYLAADEMQVFKIVEGRDYLAAWGVGGGHVGVYAVVSR